MLKYKFSLVVLSFLLLIGCRENKVDKAINNNETVYNKSYFWIIYRGDTIGRIGSPKLETIVAPDLFINYSNSNYYIKLDSGQQFQIYQKSDLECGYYSIYIK